MKKIAVRYCSKTKAGNTKRIAEAIDKVRASKQSALTMSPILQMKQTFFFWVVRLTPTLWRPSFVSMRRIFPQPLLRK